MAREITADDIMEREAYGRARKEIRQRIIEMKKRRRVDVGPHASFYFENYDTMIAQVNEMLWIEGGGEAQLADELRAYNPLVPNGGELVATFMIEIDDPERRDRVLHGLGGIEESIRLEVGGVEIHAVPELGDQVERTKADGKTSAIHFLHFPFRPAEIAAFKSGQAPVRLVIEHDNYGHAAMLPQEARTALAADFD